MTLRNMRLGNAKLHSCRCGSPSEPRSPWLGVFEVPTPSDCSVFPRHQLVFQLATGMELWYFVWNSGGQLATSDSLALSAMGGRSWKEFTSKGVFYKMLKLTGKSRLDIWCPDAVNHLHPHLDTWFLNLCWESKGMCITYKCGIQI